MLHSEKIQKFSFNLIDMIRKKLLAFIFFIFFISLNAQEKILNFDVKIQIEKSGSIQVTEKITIKAEGNIFKRGLLRILPLARIDKNGNVIDVEYTISSIKKNGIDEKYFTEKEADTWKIYIGEKDIFLESANYEYEITYSTPFQVGYFENYDEIYWNVTGNGWEVPIDKSTCQILLPASNNTFISFFCYTGLAGTSHYDATCQY